MHSDPCGPQPTSAHFRRDLSTTQPDLAIVHPQTCRRSKTRSGEGSLSHPGPALPAPALLAVSSPCPGHPVPTGPFLSILPVGRESESAWPRERTETESPGRFLSLSVPQFSHLQNGNKNQPHPEDGDGSREEPRKTRWTLDVCVTPGRLRIVGILVCLAHCCVHGVQHRARSRSNLMSSC